MASIPADRLLRCADQALHHYGTAYIFEKRAARTRWKIKLLNFFGIAAPAAVGATIATYAFNDAWMETILIFAGAIGLAQLLVTIWSIVSKWDDQLSYCMESKSANYRLSSLYDDLRSKQWLSTIDFQTELSFIGQESQFRSDLDHREDITDKEKRMGMRSGLRRFGRQCRACNEVPKSTKSKNCDVCGNFKWWNK
jgi:mobilome CxxCx(11)CxxC protein